MEFRKPPDEHLPPQEQYALPENEFYGQKPVKRKKAEESGHRKLLKMILMPALATVGALGLVLASEGYDPLGNNALTVSVDVTPVPATEAPEPTETPFFTPEPTVTPEPTPEPTEVPEGDWDEAFPQLDNLDPDFAGAYAWSGEGSEEYVSIIESGAEDSTFLEMGSVWGTMTGANGEYYTVGTIEGAVYDSSTNTLTLTDFTGQYLDVNLMGNGFTVRLVGDNHLNGITIWGAMYGGSVTFEGPGKLTVDAGEGGNAISLNCEDSGSCVMIAGDATLDIYGTVYVYDSSLEKVLWYLMPIVMEGGRMERVSGTGDGYYTYAVVDENGAPSTHVVFRPMWETAP